jgi:predicted methyltransferase
VISDYVAAAEGTRDTQSLHRIDPEVIKSEVTAAGFKLEAESNSLMNPSDDLAIVRDGAPLRLCSASASRADLLVSAPTKRHATRWR